MKTNKQGKILLIGIERPHETISKGILNCYLCGNPTSRRIGVTSVACCNQCIARTCEIQEDEEDD